MTNSYICVIIHKCKCSAIQDGHISNLHPIYPWGTYANSAISLVVYVIWFIREVITKVATILYKCASTERDVINDNLAETYRNGAFLHFQHGGWQFKNVLRVNRLRRYNFWAWLNKHTIIFAIREADESTYKGIVAFPSWWQCIFSRFLQQAIFMKGEADHIIHRKHFPLFTSVYSSLLVGVLEDWTFSA